MNVDQFDGDWPELFGPNAHQAGWFGEGLAEAAVDLEKTWADLLERYRGTDAERRNPSLLGDSLLGSVFPYLQASLGVDQDGTRRLIASLASSLAPPRTYWNLCLGRTTEGIPPAALSCIVLGIAGLPDGHGVALEILHMHFHGGRNQQSAWNPSLIECGRRLLEIYPLIRLNTTRTTSSRRLRRYVYRAARTRRMPRTSAVASLTPSQTGEPTGGALRI